MTPSGPSPRLSFCDEAQMPKRGNGHRRAAALGRNKLFWAELASSHGNCRRDARRQWTFLSAARHTWKLPASSLRFASQAASGQPPTRPRFARCHALPANAAESSLKCNNTLCAGGTSNRAPSQWLGECVCAGMRPDWMSRVGCACTGEGGVTCRMRVRAWGAHLVDSEMRQKRLMIINGKSLEGLLHVDGQVHVVERTILSELHLALERDASLVLI